MAVNPVPEGYHSLNYYLIADGAMEAIEFYKRAFGAEERMVFPGPDDKVGHAELQIGDSVLMLADPSPDSIAKPPNDLGGTTAGAMLYVDNVDAVVERAVEAGATLTVPVEDKFWGDRAGRVTDPFGHDWNVATHVEDVPPDEMEKRVKDAIAQMG
jgi:PhnB protein